MKTTLWENVDLTAETRRTAERRGAGKRSVHERLEEYLLAKPRIGSRRWILCNDGAGEIADYLVLEEMSTGEVALSLWHAKGASGEPSVRIGDFQIVVAQALRSRGVLPSTTLWEQLGRRLNGEESPRAVLVNGSDSVDELRQRLGLSDGNEDPAGDGATWVRRLPVVIGKIAIAQPGLSAAKLRQTLAAAPVGASAVGLNQLFSVLLDTAISDGAELEILVSP